ncbi:MAG TPA: tail fiber domain-containing protein [Longimicrobiaceae bacterium]|nr:tail fiber domain-containing protein [Longimicrobiaceae bacterium]
MNPMSVTNTTTRLLRLSLAAAGFLALAAPAGAQTPDSAFAVSSGGMGLFRVNVDAGALFGGVYDGDGDGSNIPAEGAGTRMMWYPNKGAFRAGGISGTQWDAANIGDYSVAIGQDVRASASTAVAFGLRSTAAQQSSFAAGEDNTASGAASVALGYHAHTNARQGSFVFSDRSSVDSLRAGVNHSANWRVSGGFRIFTASNLSTGVTIQSGASVSNWGQSNAVISTSTGALLSTGGTWTNASDVNRKHLFEEVTGEDVLARLRAIPIRSWSYRAEPDEVRHLGPTAQDFRAAFGLGTDERSIATVDADGVALAAAQALTTRTDELRAENAELRGTVAGLREQVTTLEAQNAALEARLRRIEEMLAAQAAPPQR